MTVSITTASAGPFSGNGSTTAFPFTFKAMSTSELEVRQTIAGVETVVAPAGYTATVNAGEGGTITLVTAPAVGTSITIYSNPSFGQQVSFANAGAFLPAVVDQALDRAAVRDIYLRDIVQGTASDFAAMQIDFTQFQYDFAGNIAAAASNATTAVNAANAANGYAANASATQGAIAALIAGYPGSAGQSIPVATRSVMAAISSPIGTAHLYEAGREGLFVWSGANLSAQVTSDPRQGIYVAPTLAPTGASGAWVRKFDGLASAKWWGLVYDDSTDNYAALQAALDLSRTEKLTGTQYGYGRGGFGILIPFEGKGKVLYCSQRLVVEHSVQLVFDSGAGARGIGAALRFPAGQGGILLKYDATTGGAAGSIVESPALTGGFATTEGNYHGIELQCMARVNNAYIRNFQGDGIYADTESTPYNINGSVIDNPFVERCRDGISLNGSDANAVTLINPATMNNRRWGRLQTLSIGNASVGGNSSSNGVINVGGAIPYTMCSYGGFRYYVRIGQDVACSTNAPSGAATGNAYWGYYSVGGPATEMPAWASGTQTFRAGGAAYFSGSNSQDVLDTYYVEPDQPPVRVDDTGQVLFLSPISGTPMATDGYAYGGRIVGTGSGVRTTRGLTVGDISGVTPQVPNNSVATFIQGNVYLTRATGNAFDPVLFINTTGSAATIQFQKDGANKAQIQYSDGNGVLYYFAAPVASAGHLFYANSVNIANLDYTNGFTLYRGALGYGSGAGGAVSQATSKGTGVTLNKACGRITMNSASLDPGAKVSFVASNSFVDAEDTIIVNVGGGGTANAYRAAVTAVGPGSFTVTVENITAGALAEAPVINFAVIEASAS